MTKIKNKIIESFISFNSFWYHLFYPLTLHLIINVHTINAVASASHEENESSKEKGSGKMIQQT